MVSRDPGAAHVAVAVHWAAEDSTPMTRFMGQVPRSMKDREVFQEVDSEQVSGSMAKRVVEFDPARRVPKLLARAFSVNTSGGSGTVVVALPEDVLAEEVGVVDAQPFKASQPGAGGKGIHRILSLLRNACRLSMIFVGETWTPEAAADSVQEG